MDTNWEEHRKKIIGLGETSIKKSYYPDLQAKIEALETSKTNFQAIFNSVSDGIAIHTLDGHILKLNDQARKILNITDEIDTLPLFNSLIIGLSSLEIKNVFSKALIGTPMVIEVSIQQFSNNKVIPVYISSNQILWDEQKVIVSVLRDFSQRKKFENQLIKEKEKVIENEKKFRLLFQNMSSAFAYHKIITNKNGKPINYIYIEVNSMFEKLTGLKANDVLGKKVLDVMPNLEPIWIEKFGRVALTGESIEYTNFVETLGKYYKAKAYCPQKGYFAVTFNDVSAEVESEKVIKESEEMYRTIVELSPEGIITMSLSGNILTVNKSFLELSGFDENQFIGKHFLTIPTLINEDIKTLEFFFRGIVKDHINKNIELRWKDISGNIHYGEAHIAIIKNANNRFFQAIIRDLTDTKIAQKKLKESEERFNLAMTAVNEGIFDWNIASDSIFFDSRYFTMAGYEPNEFPHNFSEFYKRIHPDDVDSCMSQIQDHLKGKTSTFDVEFRFLKKDGDWMWIRGRGKIIERDLKGSPTRMIGTHTDITDKKIAEEAFRAKSIELENYFSNALDLFCIADFEGNFVRVNKAWEETLGYSVTELEESKFLEFVHPDDVVATLNVISHLESQEQILNFTNRYRCKDGNYRYIEWRSYPHGSLIFSAARDITDRKKLEIELIKHKENLELLVQERTEELEAANEELRSINEELFDQRNELETILERLQTAQKQLIQSEKMASIGILTAGIAHEINNPINFISSGVAGLEVEINQVVDAIKEYNEFCQKLSSDEKEKFLTSVDERYNVNKALNNIPRLIQSIRTGVNRTTNIIKGLRTFSRLDNENKTVANLSEIINSTLTILYNKYKNKITVTTEFCDNDTISCFAGKLGQLFLNVIMNSIQAIKDEGNIEIKTKYVKEKGVYKIVIKDTGMGIPQDLQQKIFDPFFTTKPVGEGTGLGLSIVLGIVKDHNGEIKLKSEEGTGTEISLYLPKS